MTDTTDGDPLGELGAEIERRRWVVFRENARPVLVVRNPRVPGLRVTVGYAEGWFRWAWGTPFAPASAVAEAADQILFVLREVRAAWPACRPRHRRSCCEEPHDH